MRMSVRILHIGNAVKITHGDLKGLFGIIVEIRENEANVFLPLQDVTIYLPFSLLRKHLKVGDEVHILLGDNQGVMGWVVNQDDKNLYVFNNRTGMEVNVLLLNCILLAFHYLLGRGIPWQCQVFQLSLFLCNRIPGSKSSFDRCTKACHEGGLK